MQDRISRRQALKVIGTTALAAGIAPLAACGSDDEPTSGSSASSGSSTTGKKLELTMFVFPVPGLIAVPKQFVAEYSEKHPNVNVKLYEATNLEGYPKMLAARKVDPDKPLVNLGFFNAATTAQGDADGMWNALDYDAMANAGDVLPIFQRENHNGIGIGADQVGLAYNSKTLSSPPSSWSELWDPANKGKIVLFDYFWYAVYMAARESGGSIEDMGAGWDLWEQRAKDGQIHAIVDSNDALLKTFSDGSANLTDYWNGTTLQAKGTGVPMDYAPPAEGAISVPSYLQSVAGSTEDQMAVSQEIIDGLLSPEWSARWSEASVQVPTNANTTIPAKLADLPAFQKETVDKLIEVDFGAVAKQNAAWQEEWDRRIKANI